MTPARSSVALGILCVAAVTVVQLALLQRPSRGDELAAPSPHFEGGPSAAAAASLVVEAEAAAPVAEAAAAEGGGADGGAGGAPEEVILYRDAFAIKGAFKRRMADYAAMHNAAYAARGAERANFKFIEIAPSGQLCNRMRGVLSAFLLALLTDRVLVVPGFLYGETRFLDLFEDPGFAWYRAPPYSLPSSQSLSLSDAEALTCRDCRDISAGTIRLKGAYYAGTLVSRNPRLKAELRRLFHDDDLARPLLAHLFQPRADLLRTAMATADALRGAAAAPHMTTFHLRSEFPVSAEEWAALRRCSEAVLPLHVGGAGRVARFAAADSMAMRGEAVERLGEGLGFYLEDFQKGSRRAGLQEALVDLLVASLGDQVFLSPFSSFSRVIALYVATPEVFVVTDGVMPQRDPHHKLEALGVPLCYRFHSKEPAGTSGRGRGGRAPMVLTLVPFPRPQGGTGTRRRAPRCWSRPPATRRTCRWSTARHRGGSRAASRSGGGGGWGGGRGRRRGSRSAARPPGAVHCCCRYVQDTACRFGCECTESSTCLLPTGSAGAPRLRGPGSRKTGAPRHEGLRAGRRGGLARERAAPAVAGKCLGSARSAECSSRSAPPAQP